MSAALPRAEVLVRDAYARRSAEKPCFLVAIDGRCASGKTTLAASLAIALSDIGCGVLHMDDFFLRPEQRTPERLATPGENIDHERFLEEVLLPLSAGKAFRYTPFSCRTQSLGATVEMNPAPIMLIEGAYACHPSLCAEYDLRLFLSVDPETQMARITARNGEASAAVFRDRWIPLEEAYIAACEPQKHGICLP